MKKMVFACVALAALLGACYGADTVTFKANYKLRNKIEFPNGVVNGIVYYHYDKKTPLNSRVRFETTYNGNNVHTEFYHYGNGALYSMCSLCTASVLGSSPEQWGQTIGDICDDADGEGYKRCQRAISSTIGVVEFEVKGTFGENGYEVRYIKFSDGREYELYNFETITYSGYKTKFELQKSEKCPEPICKSFMDVVFILDASGSVDNSEWRQQKEFLLKAIKKFKIDEDNARVGIVEFCGPNTCCKNPPNGNCVTGWWNFEDWLCPQNNITDVLATYYEPNYPYNNHMYDERRYASDCDFDGKCKPKDNYGNVKTAKVFMDLKSQYSGDQVERQISNSLENTRISGNTCQRYGLIEAYNMLFGDGKNPRCDDQNNRTECPIPVVIVITDGCDYCHESTKYWAEQIKNKDQRGILLEVGVGLEYEYDRLFLVELSSKIGGANVSINVNGYSEVSSILDKVISPVCTLGQTSTSTCGTSCKGYCACSECFCPDCSDEVPNCKSYQCTDSRGCRERNVTCELDLTQYDPQCYSARCDESDGQCKTDEKDCEEYFVEKLGRPLTSCEKVSCDSGCLLNLDDDVCQDYTNLCRIGICDPGNVDPNDPDYVEGSGCRFENKTCDDPEFDKCQRAECVPATGQCKGIQCDSACFKWEDGIEVPKCQPEECMVVTCNEEATSDDPNVRCNRVPFECPPSENKCMVRYCAFKGGKNTCAYDFNDTLNCKGKNVPGGCRTWKCDPEADGGKGACVAVEQEHEYDPCIEYTCGEDDIWEENPRCQSTKACKTMRCEDDGTCSEKEVDCTTKVDIPNKCFQAACREPDGCYKKQYYGAHFDVCGRCVSAEGDDREDSFSSVEDEECEMTSEEDLPTEGLAAAAIALIVIGAIIIGAAVALSSVVGTKALIDRARGAANQSVVSNPLFEESQTEMTNPGFMGDA